MHRLLVLTQSTSPKQGLKEKSVFLVLRVITGRVFRDHLTPWFSTRDDSAHRGRLAMSGDIAVCQERSERWCYWHLVGRGQGCCRTSYKTQDSPAAK